MIFFFFFPRRSYNQIVPSAFFTGPHQLLVAGKLSTFVNFLITFFYPLAYPISILLDKIFGHEEESANISRGELEAWMRLQTSNSKKEVIGYDKLQRTSNEQHDFHSHHHDEADPCNLTADEVEY